MSDYYGRDGQPISQDEWLREWTKEKKRVDRTEVGDVEVSTVHLGLNHQWGDGPPLIFETMTFGGEHDGWCWRYGTEEDAKRGHQAVVDALRDGRELDDLAISS